jgi:hypothetical protein
MAKEHAKTLIDVMDTVSSTLVTTYSIPETAAHSTTHCDTSGKVSVYGRIDANTDCQTTTTPGRPAGSWVTSVPQENVHATILGDHVNLQCQGSGWQCVDLQPGQYQAAIKRDSVLVYCQDLDGKKQHKIKYRNVGSW